MTAAVTPLEARCEVCLDTGSKSQDVGGYLDCFACDVADQRVKFREQMGAIGENVWGGATDALAWRAYQLGKAAAAPVVPVAAQPVVPEGWYKELSTLRDNTETFGPYSQETARVAIECCMNALEELEDAAPSLEAKPAETIKYGCHIDLPEGEHDACVLDDPSTGSCVYAVQHGEEGRNKCGEWKPIKIIKAQPAGEVALADAMKVGYEGGTLVTDPTNLGATINLHYESSAEAENAFEAIVGAIDHAIAMAQGEKHEGL